MPTIKLNELPSIKQAVIPVNSGEVKLIDAGGLVLPNVGAPVLGTDGANKDYVDANDSIWTEFTGDSSATTGTELLVTITAAPVLMTLRYDADNSRLLLINTNPSGPATPALTINYGVNALSSINTLTHSYTTPSPTTVAPPGAITIIGDGLIQFPNLNDQQPFIITVNEAAAPVNTYVFELRAFRCVAGVIISGRYRIANLS